MPLGRTSAEKLSIAHLDLRLLFEAVADGVDAGECPGVDDITVLCSFRGRDEQNAAFDAKPQRSKKRWPESGHNHVPPLAVDVAPFPVVWADVAAFEALQIYVRKVAARLGVALKPKIAWDLPHYELRSPRQGQTGTGSSVSGSSGKP